ncbi:MAG: universal stress protein [Flavobacteriales bacterium]|nr:universal stress protein [Flavobacteriales bacterium]
MHNILIPTDFSDNARQAVDYAIKVFGVKGHYTLANAFEVPHSGATMLISIADILQKDALQLLNDERERLFKKYPEMVGQIEVEAVMGSPVVAVKKMLKSGKHDVVVMGTKGASGLKEVFIGSVAANTMAEVDYPVIAVPNDAQLTVPKKILFAADDRCLSEGKLPDALVEVANMLNAEVLILNVVPEGELVHVGSSNTSNAKPIGVFENVKHSIHFTENSNVQLGIRNYITDHEVDLLSMVTRKKDLFSNLFGTSNTKNMMMHTDIPLMAFH